jgi:hypothetical protein
LFGLFERGDVGNQRVKSLNVHPANQGAPATAGATAGPHKPPDNGCLRASAADALPAPAQCCALRAIVEYCKCNALRWQNGSRTMAGRLAGRKQG